MLFGASYYHEYQPYERLHTDLDLMVEAGFTVIRVGESTWASYEPLDGEIGFDALARVVDAAAERGLSVIVGTPTYAAPAWMARLHPEIMAVTPAGEPLPYGARQNVDNAGPVFRRFAERIVRAMGERFGSHPAVAGFQVDNEIGVQNLANPHVVERFRRHVLERHGTVEAVNDRWGLTYWSHRLTDIDDLWGPAGNTNPGYALEWARFQESLTLEFVRFQRDILREVIDDDKIILHDLIGGHSGWSTSVRGIPRALDKTGINVYVPLQNAIARPEPDRSPGLAPWWLPIRGSFAIGWLADMGWSLRGERGEPFAVMEAQAASIGEHAVNIPAFPGQLKIVAYTLLVRGADLLAYWHWHTLHFGTETYWGGVLGHDLEPGRVFGEVAAIGAELKALGEDLDGLRPVADLAILTDRDSYQALSFFPALTGEGEARADPDTYPRIEMAVYEAAASTRAQVRIVHLDGDIAPCRVLVVPALYIATDEALERLVELARAGTHVIFTFRTGYADEWARVRPTRAPGPLREPLGISYQEYSTLARPVRLVGQSDLVEESSLAHGWADFLQIEADDVEVLARYDDPFLGDYPAITTRALGRGRVTWLGTLPDTATTARLLDWALDERGVTKDAAQWPDLPDEVAVSSARLPDGRTVWTVANHSWTALSFAAPPGAVDLASGAPRAVIELSAWDTRLVSTDSR